MDQFAEFFKNNTLLVMAFIGLTGGIVWTFVAGRTPGVGRLGPADVTRLVNQQDAIVIDVRPDAEFRQGHIVGSINVPQKQLESHLTRLQKYKNKPVVAVCKMGQESARAGAELKKQGFEQVHTLQGGLMAWQQAALPLAKS